MTIDEFAATQYPDWNPNLKDTKPGLYKSMVACLYYSPSCPLPIRALLDPNKTSDRLKQRADRMKSMETGEYINNPKNMSKETQERLAWHQANKLTN